MPRKMIAGLLDLSAAPVHSAASSCLLAVADVTEIAAILDRRGALKLGVAQLLLDVPMRIPVTGWIAERTLQRCHRSIDSTLTPTRDASESVHRGRAKGGAIGRR